MTRVYRRADGALVVEIDKGPMTFCDHERIEGYRDGRDTNTPEPNMNRTASYRHGFRIGRADATNTRAYPSISDAIEASKQAELQDQENTIWQ